MCLFLQLFSLAKENNDIQNYINSKLYESLLGLVDNPAMNPNINVTPYRPPKNPFSHLRTLGVPAGINNLGNTCYMSVILQMICHNYGSSLLFSLTTDDEYHQESIDIHKYDDYSLCLTRNNNSMNQIHNYNLNHNPVDPPLSNSIRSNHYYNSLYSLPLSTLYESSNENTPAPSLSPMPLSTATTKDSRSVSTTPSPNKDDSISPIVLTWSPSSDTTTDTQNNSTEGVHGKKSFTNMASPPAGSTIIPQTPVPDASLAQDMKSPNEKTLNSVQSPKKSLLRCLQELICKLQVTSYSSINPSEFFMLLRDQTNQPLNRKVQCDMTEFLSMLFYQLMNENEQFNDWLNHTYQGSIYTKLSYINCDHQSISKEPFFFININMLHVNVYWFSSCYDVF